MSPAKLGRVLLAGIGVTIDVVRGSFTMRYTVAVVIAA